MKYIKYVHCYILAAIFSLAHFQFIEDGYGAIQISSLTAIFILVLLEIRARYKADQLVNTKIEKLRQELETQDALLKSISNDK